MFNPSFCVCDKGVVKMRKPKMKMCNLWKGEGSNVERRYASELVREHHNLHPETLRNKIMGVSSCQLFCFSVSRGFRL